MTCACSVVAEAVAILVTIVGLLPVVGVTPVLPDERRSSLVNDLILRVLRGRLKTGRVNRVNFKQGRRLSLRVVAQRVLMLVRVVSILPVISVSPVFPDQRLPHLIADFVLGILGRRLETSRADRIDLHIVAHAVFVLVRVIHVSVIVGVSPVLEDKRLSVLVGDLVLRIFGSGLEAGRVARVDLKLDSRRCLGGDAEKNNGFHIVNYKTKY